MKNNKNIDRKENINHSKNNKNIDFIIKEIENLNKQIKNINFLLNKKEDDIKNIINEKDSIIKEMNNRLLKQENIIEKNNLEISDLNKQINQMRDKIINSFKEKEEKINNNSKVINNIIDNITKKESDIKNNINEIKNSLLNDINAKYNELKTITTNINNSELMNIKYSISILEKEVLNEYEKNEARNNGFLLFGKTGAGKTNLLNSIFGKEVGLSKKSAFEVTKECKIHYYKLNNGKCISFLDTPGLSYKDDFSNNNELVLKNISHFIQLNNIKLKGLLFVVNYQCERFDSSDQKTLLILNNLFPVKRFWKNLIIIFTHVFEEPDMDDIKEMMEIRNQSNRSIFSNLMDKVKNVSDKIDYNDLIIKYFNSYRPIKKKIMKERNLKVRNELEEGLDILIKREYLN